ncbi:MAG: sugar ABC transporter permease [Candidatus Bathyarchaeota archaeon]|nr:sugar ABC transporter permease [Candidatus Bathyarchaeota archaeon]
MGVRKRFAGLKGWSNDLEKFPTILMIPISIMLNLIAIFPLFILAYAAVTDWSPSTGSWFNANIIWYGNLIRMAEDTIFQMSIVRTAAIVLIATALEFAFGLILALLFVEEFRGRRILISVFLLPMMVIPAVSGYMFFMIFGSAGPINAIISILIGETYTLSWLTLPNYALMATILMDVWQWTPFMFLILLSGMLALPADPINAAKVLGASQFTIFRRVSMPMMKRIIMIALILRSIECFKLMDGIYIMTFGGPGYHTQTISMWLYEAAFRYLDYGFVSAVALVIFVGLGIISWFAIKPLRGG